MHDFILIGELQKCTGYLTRRSIKKWLSDELGIQLLKIGKQYCVRKEQFEKAIAKYSGGKLAKPSYRPQLPAEKAFLADLQCFLNELP